ncbi:formylglycine-generating enzyme family protein [Bremerella sp. JC817]|uniref:formylglycine-generating enzyme family protein n=1 Tax=Bremerella sp. JC817 TaxID=3231756 RepID=UPI00345A5977
MKHSKTKLALGITCVIAGGAIYFSMGQALAPTPPQLAIDSPEMSPKPLAVLHPIPGGRYLVGKDSGPRHAQPAQQIHLDPFSIERTEVTNAMFGQFVEQTGYQTDAERRGESLCFDKQTHQFMKKQGAHWRQPAGPGSSILGKDDHPVVHISWYDANAYAKWAGKSLPSEFQWEAAARGKQLEQDYPWPTTTPRPFESHANLWQGDFPLRDQAADGYTEPAPVATFPSNAHGLHDMAGNVAEWTSSWYAEDSLDRIDPRNPVGPRTGELKVVRGGSWLSSDQTGTSEAMVWYRSKLSPEMSNNFTGFRCIEQN